MASEEFLDLTDFTVLIVDDYPFVANVLTSALNEMGVGRILTADNGERAIDHLQTYNSFENGSSIDVVLMDWLMPTMSGKELLDWIRKNKKETIHFLPVIVCSAYTSGALVRESRDMGANEVIVKPFSASEIARRIQYVINHPRPFVKSKTFFGPDRRRQNKHFDHEDRRKAKPQDMKANYEQK